MVRPTDRRFRPVAGLVVLLVGACHPAAPPAPPTPVETPAEVTAAPVANPPPTQPASAPEVSDPIEELFSQLHASDGTQSARAAEALLAQGLTLGQISLARQLTHPDPVERLNLLSELKEGVVPDVGPWLERLSRDPVPAVRLGAARVAAETGHTRAKWLATLAATDPHPTVRQWASYYQNLDAR